MGRQRFCCKGVQRSSGQRVSIMVSADNKESALQIANTHGVAVESIMPVAEAAPAPPKVVEKNVVEKNVVEKKADGKKLDARIEDILSAEDEELSGGLDDLDLDDDAGGATSPNSPTTKACPYCGEQILAVAVKCKHCGSYVGEKAAKPRQPSGEAAPKGAPMRVWLVVGGIVAVVVLVPIVIVAGWIMSRSHAAAPVVPTIPEPVTVSPPSAPVAPVAPLPAPKPEAYKPSPEEVVFAGKLAAFLDSCDELVALLEKGAKTEQYTKKNEVIKSRRTAIPAPPKGIAWAEDAAQSSDRILLALSLLDYGNATQDALAEALKQSPTDSPENRQAYRQVAGEIRRLVTAIRATIPPACLPKPK